ncbi:hypothetical protein [Microcoleus sp. bin38.metabat.b11b12b14.051]|uniref:hypothetical protein n=1 Tax=Microcoleus sp. bin38.metabat.b11b12b14.051 TaxID=2742709 RepID=UPI0025DFE2AA|nr:hypothetical protein [Microcoleus sp. bin38.metabat.b11b12b14.051]
MFEPTSPRDKKLLVTDRLFKDAIADISSQNMLFFTRKQFLHLIHKRLQSPISRSENTFLEYRLLWIPTYLFISLFVIFFSGFIMSTLAEAYFPNIHQTAIFFLIPLIIYNLAWIGRFVKDSQSPERGISGRIVNAENFKDLGVTILLTGIPISLRINSSAWYITSTLLGLSSYGIGFLQKRRQAEICEHFLANEVQVDEWLERWQTANGTLEKLLPTPAQNAFPATINSEISTYAIICQSDEIAQFLIANNVASENNCTILSINGYPQSIFDTAMEILRHNADFKVYVLHDATPAGVDLANQLRTNPNWFANQDIRIFDLGIFPHQILEDRDISVRNSKTMAEAARQLSYNVRLDLTVEEIAWLDAGNFVELESFEPSRLLRIVNSGLAMSTERQTNDGLMPAHSPVHDSVGFAGEYVFNPPKIANKNIPFSDQLFQKAIVAISTENVLFFTPKQFLYFIDKKLKWPASVNQWIWIFLYLFLLGFAITIGGFFLVILLLILPPLLVSQVGSVTISPWLFFQVALVTPFLIFNYFSVRAFREGSRSLHQGIRDRRINAINLVVLGVLILVLGIPTSLITLSIVGLILVLCLGIYACSIGVSQKRHLQTVNEELFTNELQMNQWLQRWQRAMGRIDKLLPTPRQNALPITMYREISTYICDRAIICDSDEIAQFLIANNVDVKKKCAIFSISGYPQSIFDTTMKILRQNANLKVYALHNASPTGISLVHQLRTNSDWFAEQDVTIFDLSISPCQILESQNMFVKKSPAMAETARQLPYAVRLGLTTEELAWLDAGNFVELESFSPQELLSIVNSKLAESGDPQSIEGLGE